MPEKYHPSRGAAGLGQPAAGGLKGKVGAGFAADFAAAETEWSESPKLGLVGEEGRRGGGQHVPALGWVGGGGG